jgi:hypothetical protein
MRYTLSACKKRRQIDLSKKISSKPALARF